jgi:hypothetical protein
MSQKANSEESKETDYDDGEDKEQLEEKKRSRVGVG